MMSTISNKRTSLLVAISLVSVAGLIVWLLTPAPLRLQQIRAGKGPMSVSIDNEGIVRVRDAYVVASPIAATVERITLRIGDPVMRGDVIAWLAPLPVDMQAKEQTLARMKAAEARWTEALLQQSEAEITHELARHELERRQALARDHFISPQALEQFIVRESTMRAAARAAVHAVVRAPERRLPVRAPASGRVLAISQQSERTIAAGQPLIIMGDPLRMEAVVDVLSVDAVKVQPGMRMQLQNWGGDAPLAHPPYR